MSDLGRVVILGMGPSGLGAAYRLAALNYENVAIYERESEAGGLASSVEDGMGFVWDYGCHVLYSRSTYFNDVMDAVLPEGWIEQPRDAQVWMDKGFVPYPLQYNLHRLPKAIQRECVLGLARAASQSASPSEANFKDWIVNAFGDGLAAHFMIPYNQKVWAHPLEEMGVTWISERVPRPDLVRVLSNFLDCKDDDGWGPNARFRYPIHGGAGAIWRAVARALPQQWVNFGATASHIDTTRRQITFTNGRQEHYDTLISGIPLDHLIAQSDLTHLRPTTRALKSSEVHVVGLGIAGELPALLAGRKWIYFPDLSLPFYRVTILSNFSSANAPAGHWSLLAECATSEHRPLDPRTIVESVIAGFTREGLIPAGAPIVSRFHHVATPGYPTPTLTRDAALASLLPELEARGIYSRGRFGSWRYEIANQDHSFLLGSELVGRLLLDEPEPTLASP